MKIPDNAKKVHKGIIYDVYQWEQKLFDGKTKTYEGLKRKPGVQIFAVVDNGVMLLEEEQPGHGRFLSVPGGNTSDNEDVLVCAKRELLEETGLTSDDWALWKKVGVGLSMEFDTYYFIARNCKKTGNQSLDEGQEKILSTQILPVKDFLKALENGNVRNESLQAMAISICYDDKKFREFSAELRL